MPQSPSTLVPQTQARPIKIGSVTLSINPQSVQESMTRQVYYQANFGGAIRHDYGNGPREWTITGHTGQGGKTAIAQLQGLEAQPNTPQKPVSLLYPHKYGSRVFSVYVDDVQWSETAQDPFYFSYSLKLREAAPNSTQPPIVPVFTPTSQYPTPASSRGG